jgi:hypothetical protein
VSDTSRMIGLNREYAFNSSSCYINIISDGGERHLSDESVFGSYSLLFDSFTLLLKRRASVSNCANRAYLPR